MESDVFFDYYLKSLRFHLGDRCKDIGFIEFSCGIIYSKGVVTGVEVCMNVLELERLNNLYKI